MVAKDAKIKRIQLTSVQLVVLFYLGAVTFSTILLSLPFFHKEGIDLAFIDILFTAVSAISVTGLTVVPIADTFNTWGYFALAFVLQLGGVGVMALGTFIWLLLGKRIGLKERQLIMVDQNRSTLQGLVQLMKHILFLILFIEFLGGIILSLYYLNYFSSISEAFIQGFFASISATTNGGFDITGQSLIPFADDYFVQFIHMLLIIFGAIGFPVLVEIKQFLSSKAGTYRFSLFTKLTSITFFALVIFGAISIYLIEFGHFLQGKSWHASLFYSLFQSVTTRSGGLATLDITEFSLSTLVLLAFLMFIGASPSSVGGGIRTTTFALVILAIFSFAKGNQTVKVFKREVMQEDLMKAFIVTTVAMIMWAASIVILTISEPHSLIEIMFEVSSAFGTTGLSMGITPDLTSFGKVVIMCIMFIGRIGLLTFLFIIRGKQITERYHYPKESVIIG